jgi:hypothetical protein
VLIERCLPEDIVHGFDPVDAKEALPLSRISTI